MATRKTAQSSRKCPSTVAALTKALAKASAKEKVAHAKKRAEAKVLAVLKKKATTKKHGAFERAAKKITAIWEKPKRAPKLAYGAGGNPIMLDGKHLTVAEVNRKLRG